MGDYGFGLLQTAGSGAGSGGGAGLFGGGAFRSSQQFPSAAGSALFLPGYPQVLQDELLLGVSCAPGKHSRGAGHQQVSPPALQLGHKRKDFSPQESAAAFREELKKPGEVNHRQGSPKAEDLGVEGPDKLLPASPSSSSSSSCCSAEEAAAAGDTHVPGSPPSLGGHQLAAKNKLQMDGQSGHLLSGGTNLLGSPFPGSPDLGSSQSPGGSSSSPSLPGFGTPWSVQTSSPPPAPPSQLPQQQPSAPHPTGHNLNALQSPEPDSFYPGIPSSINPAFFHSFSPVSANPCPGMNVPGFSSPFSAQISISQQQQSRRSPVSPQLNPQHHQAAAFLQQRNNYNHHQSCKMNIDQSFRQFKMEMDLSINLAIAYSMSLEEERKRARRRRRRFWQHPIVVQRPIHGVYYSLYAELQENPQKFMDYIRMSRTSFQDLMNRVGPSITKQDTRLRRPIPAEERLLVTLRFLATGESLSSLHFQFRIGVSTLSGIIEETCRAICDVLREEFLPFPTTQIWINNAARFQQICQFPNCIGAVDGKHIRILKPARSGSQFYNYKKFFSIVLMAIVDADCRFVSVDIGSFGRGNDSQIFKVSDMGLRVYNNDFNFPPPQPFPNTTAPPMPFVLVGDEAFQMCGNLLKPYSSRDLNHTKKIYNYRLTRARRTVECAFGILSSKWRILGTAINLKTETVDEVVKACVVLHNFIMVKEAQHFDLDDLPTAGFQDLTQHNMRPSMHVLQLRDKFAEFFLTDMGRVEWQDQMV